MSQIEIQDWVIEAALTAYMNAWNESVTKRERCLTDWNDDQIDHAREGVKAALRAALEGWLVAVGVRYRVAPNDASRARPWEGAGIVAEWNRSLPNSSETLQYQPLYTFRKEPAA